MGISKLMRVACLLALLAVYGGIVSEAGDVQELDGGNQAQQRVDMRHLGETGETINMVQEKATAKSFDIFGFFGCCYHCKHHPTCTEKCMHKHHIENGSASMESRRPMSHERLVQAAHTIAFVQEANGYHKHKPIKLHLAQGAIPKKHPKRQVKHQMGKKLLL